MKIVKKIEEMWENTVSHKYISLFTSVQLKVDKKIVFVFAVTTMDVAK